MLENKKLRDHEIASFSILLKERGYKNRRLSSSRLFIRRARHPKVKVKVRDDSGDRDDVKRDILKSPLLGLKALDSLSLSLSAGFRLSWNGQ